MEVGSWYLYASFDTLYVKIGQLFEKRLVLEKCLKTVKSLFLEKSVVNFEFFRKFKVSLRLE